MNEFNQAKPAPFAISSMSYKPAPITWGSRIHYHDFLETAVVLNGNGFFTTHDHTISVQKGDILLSPPGQYHCLYPASQDLEYCTATLLPGSGFLTKERKRPTASLTHAGAYTSQLVQLARLVFSLHKEAPVQGRDACYSCASSLVYLMSLLFSQDSQPIINDSGIRQEATVLHQIYHYISDHLEEKITLDSLGRMFAVSPSHLSHQFSAEFGISPIDLAIQSRIIYSTVDLILSNRTVEEIAFRSGFDSATGYIRQFKKKIGQTPADFRKKNRSHLIHF